MTYVLANKENSPERHHPYFDAFLHAVRARVDGHYRKSYLQIITDYINDPGISCLDADDLELFQILLYEGPWGKIHIVYYVDQIEEYERNEVSCDQLVNNLARYADYLNRISALLVNDMFYHIFRLWKWDDISSYFRSMEKGKPVIEGLLSALSPETKLKMVQVADQHHNIVQHIPKLKLYLTFS